MGTASYASGTLHWAYSPYGGKYRASLLWSSSTDATAAGTYVYWGTCSGTYDGAGSPQDAGAATAWNYDFLTCPRRYFALASYTSTGGVDGKSQEIPVSSSEYTVGDVPAAEIAEFRLKWGLASGAYCSTSVFPASQRAVSLRDVFPAGGVTYYALMTASTQEGASPVRTTTEETITVTGRSILVR